MIRIRPGTRRDLPALRAIECETAGMFPPSILPPHLARPLPPMQLLRALAATLLWVADEATAGPIGFVLARRAQDSLHLVEMDVHPAFARRGIGTRLLLHACAGALERGLAWVTLTTFAQLPWNAPFYGRRGFAVATELAPFPHLAAALREERARGLVQRVAMVRAPALPASQRSSPIGPVRRRALPLMPP